MPKQIHKTGVAAVLSGALISLPVAAFNSKSVALGCVGLGVWALVAVVWLIKDGK